MTSAVDRARPGFDLEPDVVLNRAARTCVGLRPGRNEIRLEVDES
ncbi:hypothetical protein [uncultured Friedmanniella sp.]